jgi:hypothetical protein
MALQLQGQPVYGYSGNYSANTAGSKKDPAAGKPRVVGFADVTNLGFNKNKSRTA